MFYSCADISRQSPLPWSDVNTSSVFSLIPFLHNNFKFLSCYLIFTLLLCSCDKNKFAPEIHDQEFYIEENSPFGAVIGAIDAFDADEEQIISYKIVDGNLDGTFKINLSNGILSVADARKLDYEKNTQFILTISVTDNHDKEPLESSAKIQVNLTDQNEFAPTIESQTFTLDENPLNGQEIGKIIATDEDSHQSLSFSIEDPGDGAYFNINSVTGSLSVKDSSIFDFETIQQIEFRIIVKDDHTDFKTAKANIILNIKIS